MKTRSIVSILFLYIFLSSCNQGNNEPLKPTPSGAPGDLLLVVNDKIWESAAGDTLRNILASPVDALPQNEPQFDVIQIRHAVFDKNFKTQRNIIVVKVGADQSESKIVVQKGLWARSQLLIGIQATDQQALIDLLEKERENILNLLIDAERKRLMAAYHKSMDKVLTDKLRKDHSIIMTVPVGFTLDVEEEDFLWLTQEYRDIIQSILIYKYPYTDAETFTPAYLTEKRNQITKAHVPGEVEGSYMTTEPLFPPVFSEYALRNNRYAAELKGLWRMEGGLAMGGPFINITQLDEARNTVVSVDAFVFAPGHKKRDLLRQLEAIILTLDFTSPGQEEEE